MQFFDRTLNCVGFPCLDIIRIVIRYAFCCSIVLPSTSLGSNLPSSCYLQILTMLKINSICHIRNNNDVIRSAIEYLNVNLFSEGIIIQFSARFPYSSWEYLHGLWCDKKTGVSDMSIKWPTQKTVLYVWNVPSHGAQTKYKIIETYWDVLH